MTVVNPKSISGINSITMASGSDNLLTIHTTNTTERVRVNSDGDVIVGSGITVSPDGDIFATGVTTSTTFVGALTGNVTGNISGGTVAGSTGTFTGDVDIADKIVHTGDTDTAIRFSGADTITAETAGSARLTINSSGKIGLNQSGPYAELDITSSVEDTTTGALSAHGIRLGAVGATDEQVIPITAGFKSQQDRARAGIGFISKPQSSVEGYAGAIGFYTRASADASVLKTTDEKVRIDGNGLGIGTAANGGRLHVHDEAVNVYTKVTNNSGTRAFIGCESGEAVIYSQDSSGGNAELAFHTGSTEQFKMTTEGIAFPSGKGISFAATGDASGMTSELLDDYEEGSWTPYLTFSGTNNDATMDIQQGMYRKIGTMVFVSYSLRSTNFNGSSGAVRIGGLPYTSTNTPLANISTAGVFPIKGVSFTGEFISQQLSSTIIELYGVSKSTSSNVYTSIGVSEMNQTGEMFIKGSIFYNTP